MGKFPFFGDIANRFRTMIVKTDAIADTVAILEEQQSELLQVSNNVVSIIEKQEKSLSEMNDYIQRIFHINGLSNKEYVDIKEAAAISHLKESTLRKYVAAGEIEALPREGKSRKILIKLSSLEEYINKRSINSDEEHENDEPCTTPETSSNE